VLLAVRCLCDLLLSAAHFNFRTNILARLVSLTNSPNNEVNSISLPSLHLYMHKDM
jgi:hypothetical protein